MSTMETELVDPLRLWHHHSLGEPGRYQDHHCGGRPASSLHSHTRAAAWREYAFGGRVHGEEGRPDALCAELQPVAAQAMPQVIDADIALEETEKATGPSWAGLCRLKGKWRKQIMRSLLTLKSLTYKPTGGIVAAVTTSLPEKIGGTRNWDYRYCWLQGRHLHAAGLSQCRLHRGSRCLAALADAGDRGRAGPASDHVQRDGREAAGRIRASASARL